MKNFNPNLSLFGEQQVRIAGTNIATPKVAATTIRFINSDGIVSLNTTAESQRESEKEWRN